MGREIETQRLALLRLLAGWLAVVAFLSAMPFAPVWTRLVCSFLSSVLERAEAAAQCLLLVQARLLAGDRGIPQDRVLCERLRFDLQSDESPSLAELRRRLIALRCLLRNLPRRAARLLRRLESVRDADSESDRCALDLSEDHFADSQCFPPRQWHPPDKVRALYLCWTFFTPSGTGAEALTRARL